MTIYKEDATLVDKAIVRFFAIDMHSSYLIPTHSDRWNQLIYASSGVMSVHSAIGTWVVPPQRAVWVPSRFEHSVDLHGVVHMRTLHLNTAIPGSLPTACCVLNVPPFLRELILHIVANCPLYGDVVIHEHLVAILVDQLDTVRTAPLELPALADERAAKIAAILQRNPADQRTLAQLSAEVGVAARTIERLFRAQTGMGFAHWRRQCRLLFAMQLLAAGEPVSTVSLRVGYENPSSFIAMFREALGMTPGVYFKDSALTSTRATLP